MEAQGEDEYDRELFSKFSVAVSMKAFRLPCRWMGLFALDCKCVSMLALVTMLTLG